MKIANINIHEGDKVKRHSGSTMYTVVAVTDGCGIWVIEELTANLVWWPPQAIIDPNIRPRFWPQLMDREQFQVIAKGKPVVVTGGD